MKSFKEFIEEMNDNVDPMDVKRAYYKLQAKEKQEGLNDFEKKKKETLAKHPDVKKSLEEK